jgi:hypothetical protein
MINLRGFLLFMVVVVVASLLSVTIFLQKQSKTTVSSSESPVIVFPSVHEHSRVPLVYPVKIDFQLLFEGAQAGRWGQVRSDSGIYFLLIHNYSQWFYVWNHRFGNAAGGQPSNDVPPEVDFSKDMVLAVAVGSGTTGVRLQVQEIWDYGSYFLVNVQRQLPYFAGQMLTYPYQLVEVSATSVPFAFNVTDIHPAILP